MDLLRFPLPLHPLLLFELPFRSNLEEEGDEVEGMAVERKGNSR